MQHAGATMLSPDVGHDIILTMLACPGAPEAAVRMH